jgi:excisionase family DNA binding protein
MGTHKLEPLGLVVGSAVEAEAAKLRAKLAWQSAEHERAIKALRAGEVPMLATPKQAAKELGVTVGQIRGLVRENRLAHVSIGSRVMIPRDALQQFILNNTVSACQDETPARAFDSSISAAATTSPGPIMGARVSAARARQIANKLKSRSPSSSNSEPAAPVHVIPLKR